MGEGEGGYIISMDQILFSYFTSDHFCLNVFNSDNWFQKRICLKFLIKDHKGNWPVTPLDSQCFFFVDQICFSYIIYVFRSHPCSDTISAKLFFLQVVSGDIKKNS